MPATAQECLLQVYLGERLAAELAAPASPAPAYPPDFAAPPHLALGQAPSRPCDFLPTPQHSQSPRGACAALPAESACPARALLQAALPGPAVVVQPAPARLSQRALPTAPHDGRAAFPTLPAKHDGPAQRQPEPLDHAPAPTARRPLEPLSQVSTPSMQRRSISEGVEAVRAWKLRLFPSTHLAAPPRCHPPPSRRGFWPGSLPSSVASGIHSWKPQLPCRPARPATPRPPTWSTWWAFGRSASPHCRARPGHSGHPPPADRPHGGRPSRTIQGWSPGSLTPQSCSLGHCSAPTRRGAAPGPSGHTSPLPRLVGRRFFSRLPPPGR